MLMARKEGKFGRMTKLVSFQKYKIPESQSVCIFQNLLCKVKRQPSLVMQPNKLKTNGMKPTPNNPPFEHTAVASTLNYFLGFRQLPGVTKALLELQQGLRPMLQLDRPSPRPCQLRCHRPRICKTLNLSELAH